MKGHKPSRLHEEVPTNNTQGLYRVEPNIVVMSHPGVDDPDFDQDGDGSSGYTGTDTSGLFMPDGTIRVAEPPEIRLLFLDQWHPCGMDGEILVRLDILDSLTVRWST